MRTEWLLPLLVAALLACGLLVLSSVAAAPRVAPDVALRQLMGIGLGLTAALGALLLGRRRILRLTWPLYGASLLLLLLTLLVGQEIGGQRNWLALGPLQFQPLEVAKLGLILALAAALARGYRGAGSYLRLGAVALPPLLLVGIEDFGGGLVLAAVVVAVMLAARFPVRHLLLGAAVLALVFPLAVYPRLAPYQQARLTTFVDPYRDPLGQGYQVIQSSIAIGSGGITGKGYGGGTQVRGGFVPEPHTDFVFAAWAEEHGLIGSLLLLGLFAGLLFRITRLGAAMPRLHDALIFAGVTGQIGFQVVENVGAALGVLPVTGLTLPLISAGLSSLVATLVTLGVLYTLHRDRYREL